MDYGQISSNPRVLSSPTTGMRTRIRLSVEAVVIDRLLVLDQPPYDAIPTVLEGGPHGLVAVTQGAVDLVALQMRDQIGQRRAAIDLAAQVAGVCPGH